MRSSKKLKIAFFFSVIFFITSIASIVNTTYIYSEKYKDKISEKKIKNIISQVNRNKVIKLINTMDEAMECFENESISSEVKKQLVYDMIDSVNVINNKLDISSDALVKELSKQYNNLNKEKDIIWDTLIKLYKEWKEAVL